jgi:hypothetical protein
LTFKYGFYYAYFRKVSKRIVDIEKLEIVEIRPQIRMTLHTYIGTYIYTCIHTYTYIRTYTHTHTHTCMTYSAFNGLYKGRKKPLSPTKTKRIIVLLFLL